MMKDPTEFRERFAKWKAGELVYEAGLPTYGGGKGDIDFHDDVTKHIIRKEGILAAPKDIGDGKITIGSGLTQQKYIDQYKRNGNKWSQKENYIAVKDTVRGFENSLRGILPEYDQYPAEMRKALIDIIYNIGEGGLKNSPKFLSAMKLHNWNEAKRLMDWDNSDPLFGNGARKRNAERAALFDAGLAHWSPTGPVELIMENKPVFVPQPVFVPLTKNNTDYSIETMTSPTIPLMLNSRNSGDSPLYGGSDYSFRLPSIKEVVERLLFLGLPKYGGGKSTKKGSYYLPGEKTRRESDVSYDNSSYDSKRRYDYKYVQAGKDNGWVRITDDKMSDVFLDFVARPKSRGGNTDTYNWNKQWALKGEPELEIVSPEFDILTLGAGARINAATQAFLKSRKIANAIDKGIKENAVITGYNRNPVTKELGTLLDYQSYLDNVFPNSKIKDVLWHGSTKKNLLSFSTEYIGSNMPIKKSVGMYLAPEKITAANYGRKGDIYPVLLNTENPFITNQFFGGVSKNGINITRISPKTRSTILANNDAVIAPARGEIAFFEPNDALILGSERDVEGFRKFMLHNKYAE